MHKVLGGGVLFDLYYTVCTLERDRLWQTRNKRINTGWLRSGAVSGIN